LDKNHTNTAFLRHLSLLLLLFSLHATGMDASPGCREFAPASAAMLADFLGATGATNHEQIWGQGERLAQLGQQLQGLRDDGLAPAAYDAALFTAATALTPCLAERASYRYLQALQHLAWGRVDPEAQGMMWYEDTLAAQRAASRATTTRALIDAAALYLDDPARVFELARPATPEYRQLRQAYQQLRQRRDADSHWIDIPAGPSIRPGHSDSRVPLLALRLVMEGLLPADMPGVYAATPVLDAVLTEALRTYQHRHHITADGILGKESLRELNTTPTQRLIQVAVNLERLRWLAHDREADMLLVDIAGARISRYAGGEPQWQAKIQVGQAKRPTPALKSRLTHVTLNPTWTVPPTILKEDKLPEIRNDIDYLSQHRLRVLDRDGQELDPYSVDWSDPRGIILRQDAGPDSALGLVALRFPNPFAVYLHDTPNRNLFKETSRFFSSGCVRVEGAMDLTQALFADASPERIAQFETRRSSGKTGNVSLPRSLPLLMSYWTVEVEANQDIRFRPDIYHWDEPLQAALGRGLARD
jgi:murein L,D-transpeptidase YcbB/YkuD